MVLAILSLSYNPEKRYIKYLFLLLTKVLKTIIIYHHQLLKVRKHLLWDM